MKNKENKKITNDVKIIMKASANVTYDKVMSVYNLLEVKKLYPELLHEIRIVRDRHYTLIDDSINKKEFETLQNKYNELIEVVKREIDLIRDLEMQDWTSYNETYKRNAIVVRLESQIKKDSPKDKKNNEK